MTECHGLKFFLSVGSSNTLLNIKALDSLCFQQFTESNTSFLQTVIATFVENTLWARNNNATLFKLLYSTVTV